MVVWLSNTVTFGLPFWQLDAGGPRLRTEQGRSDPDFQFPQDMTGRAGWNSRLSDCLYVSLTNAIAVSPTDTMPLTRRAKGLMATESLISYTVVILVVQEQQRRPVAACHSITSRPSVILSPERGRHVPAPTACW